jgi:DNA-binding FadR family transcriptional regulator
VEYFRKARRFLMEHGRLGDVKQAVVNPDGNATFNLMTAAHNTEALRDVLDVRTDADVAMVGVAAAVAKDSERVAEVLAQAAKSALNADSSRGSGPRASGVIAPQ